MVVFGGQNGGNHADPNSDPFPEAPLDMSKCLQFRDDVTIAITTSGHLYVSVRRSEFVLRDTMGPLSSVVTAAHYSGAILALGTAIGEVYLYSLDRETSLPSLNLGQWIWKGGNAGGHEVLDIETLVSSDGRGVNVCYLKRNGLFARHIIPHHPS